MSVSAARHFLLSIVLAVTPFGLSAATTLYKLVDENGKITYVEVVPAEFRGKVMPFSLDPSANTAEVMTPAEKMSLQPGAKASGYLEQRRATRTTLEASLENARARLERAKRALADATVDEGPLVPRQVHSVNPNTGAITRGVRMPDEGLLARVAELEAEVTKAEEAVSVAETAYRRGVD